MNRVSDEQARKAAQILDGLRRVEESKRAVPDPDGDSPACMNAIGTWICERCGRDVRGAVGACPEVPREQRWSAALAAKEP